MRKGSYFVIKVSLEAIEILIDEVLLKEGGKLYKFLRYRIYYSVFLPDASKVVEEFL
jgi:hypothetical protein